MSELAANNTSARDATEWLTPSGVPRAVFTRKGQAWSEVTMLDGTHARLRLGGLFRTTWMAALCQGLAERRLSIDHAHAGIAHDGSWNVELSVSPQSGAPELASLPLLALVEAEVLPEVRTVRLDRQVFHDSPDHGGSLFVAVEAQDSLGLLGQLLASFAKLGLFPIEMHIETRDGRAFDSLWLCTADRQCPSRGTRTALAHLLMRLAV